MEITENMFEDIKTFSNEAATNVGTTYKFNSDLQDLAARFLTALAVGCIGDEIVRKKHVDEVNERVDTQFMIPIFINNLERKKLENGFWIPDPTATAPHQAVIDNFQTTMRVQLQKICRKTIEAAYSRGEINITGNKNEND